MMIQQLTIFILILCMVKYNIKAITDLEYLGFSKNIPYNNKLCFGMKCKDGIVIVKRSENIHNEKSRILKNVVDIRVFGNIAISSVGLEADCQHFYRLMKSSIENQIQQYGTILNVIGAIDKVCSELHEHTLNKSIRPLIVSACIAYIDGRANRHLYGLHLGGSISECETYISPFPEDNAEDIEKFIKSADWNCVTVEEAFRDLSRLIDSDEVCSFDNCKNIDNPKYVSADVGKRKILLNRLRSKSSAFVYDIATLV
jgi:20S proteasome alpha/beta subunit